MRVLIYNYLVLLPTPLFFIKTWNSKANFNSGIQKSSSRKCPVIGDKMLDFLLVFWNIFATGSIDVQIYFISMDILPRKYFI
jgi:hypothetical protein